MMKQKSYSCVMTFVKEWELQGVKRIQVASHLLDTTVSAPVATHGMQHTAKVRLCVKDLNLCMHEELEHTRVGVYFIWL